MMGECIIDPGHCWLISVGDRVTLAPRVHILAHDASLKETLGYTKIGRVKIGNITDEKKEEMKKLLNGGKTGFIL